MEAKLIDGYVFYSEYDLSLFDLSSMISRIGKGQDGDDLTRIPLRSGRIVDS